jgi:predicted TPR repeat methyltransferase
MLAATLDHTPEHPDWQYVTDFFDGYAERFDSHLIETLNYIGPAVLSAMVREACPEFGTVNRVLDIGCGTGLMGVELMKQFGCREIVGVDLSPRMLELARARGCYTDLRCIEATLALRQDPSTYDLITAADVLIYVGALDRLFAACAARLHAGGILAFSVEALAADEHAPDGFNLRDNTRYGHRRDYLITQARSAGLTIVHERAGPIRRHAGGDELGLYMLFKAGAI